MNVSARQPLTDFCKDVKAEAHKSACKFSPSYQWCEKLNTLILLDLKLRICQYDSSDWWLQTFTYLINIMCLDYRGTASAAIVSYVSTSIVNPVSLGVYNSIIKIHSGMKFIP